MTVLPSCATTGIGSLPLDDAGAALELAFSVDIPYLPQLANEPMIPAALDPNVEPSFAAWRPFLSRVRGLAKVQIAGPATVRWAERVGDDVERDEALFRHILGKASEMVQAVRSVGATPLLFVDEPGLVALNLREPRHLLVLQELALFCTQLREQGAIVGLHCCGNTKWAALLDLPVHVLSFDARLSMDAIAEERGALRAFIERGGVLSLGIIPTNQGASYRVSELVDSVEAALRSSLPSRLLPRAFGQLLLTPACGLATHPPQSAQRIFSELAQAQRLMRELVEAPVLRC